MLIFGIFDKLLSVFAKPAKDERKKKKGSNFQRANAVGIIFTAEDEGFYKKIKAIVRKLREEYGIKKVNAICFVPEKEKNVPHFVHVNNDLDFFSLDDVNWTKKPAGRADAFIKTEYDILLDFVYTPSEIATNTLAMSQAKMKVGRTSGISPDLYDLMLDLSGRDNPDEYFLQLNKYLSNEKIA